MIQLKGFIISSGAIVLVICLLLGKDLIGDLQTLITCFHNRQHDSQLDNHHILHPPNPHVPQPPSQSELHSFREAAVCSDSSTCSGIGRDTLLRNGSAVDAALATLLCNGLLAMQSMGLGGGVLLNVYSRHERRAYSILSREVAPLQYKSTRFMALRNNSELLQSALSIAVPGELLGYAEAHERFGKLPWAQLVQPTVNICHAGYTLSKHQRDALLTNERMVSTNALLREMFVDIKSGRFHYVGTHIQPPAALCHTYEQIAEHGPRSFYNGSLAAKVAMDLRDMGSSINIKDLRTFKVDVVPSVALPLGEHILHLTPPPGSGHIVGFIMNILENFSSDFKSTKELNVRQQHRIVEALKFGFVKRWLLDTQSNEELLFNLTCPTYAETIAQLINDTRTFNEPDHYGADADLLMHPEHGTAHISLLAANGDAVAATSSINFYFGSGRMGSRTGVLFNNAMADFAIPNITNYFDLPHIKGKNPIIPGQSPMSSMAPIIVTDQNGDVRLVVGAAGGSKIISVLTQILVRTLWLEQNIKTAIDAARLHHQLLPNVLEYEYGNLQPAIDALEAKGHRTQRYRVRGSAVCGIERTSAAAVVHANADYRKEGGVAGY